MPRRDNFELPQEAQLTSNPEYDKEQAEWCQRSGTDVPIIFQRIYEEHQQSTRDELREELSRFGHELGWVGTEDASSGSLGVSGYRPEVPATLVHIDRRFVVGVDNTTCALKIGQCARMTFGCNTLTIAPSTCASMYIGNFRQGKPRNTQFANVTAGFMWAAQC